MISDVTTSQGIAILSNETAYATLNVKLNIWIGKIDATTVYKTLYY
jgi:hypothetical protein